MRNWLVFLHGNAALSLWPARCGPGPPPAHNAARDRMMVDYLRAGAEALHARSAEDLKSAEDWRERRPRLQQEYLYMVGLWPLPAKTPLAATITRSMQRDGFVVDMIHYQSRPGLYVTGNLYRPAASSTANRLPAVLFVLRALRPRAERQQDRLHHTASGRAARVRVPDSRHDGPR